MSNVWNSLKRFVKEEEAPTMVEYGLLLALIAIVCIGAVTLVGNGVNNVFTGAASSLPASSGS